MPKTPEIQIMAESIIRTHEGKAYYNFKEVSKIVGCGINTVPRILNDAGILIKKTGTSKRVSAYDVAALMCTKRVSPVDS